MAQGITLYVRRCTRLMEVRLSPATLSGRPLSSCAARSSSHVASQCGTATVSIQRRRKEGGQFGGQSSSLSSSDVVCAEAIGVVAMGLNGPGPVKHLTVFEEVNSGMFVKGQAAAFNIYIQGDVSAQTWAYALSLLSKGRSRSARHWFRDRRQG